MPLQQGQRGCQSKGCKAMTKPPLKLKGNIFSGSRGRNHPGWPSRHTKSPLVESDVEHHTRRLLMGRQCTGVRLRRSCYFRVLEDKWQCQGSRVCAVVWYWCGVTRYVQAYSVNPCINTMYARTCNIRNNFQAFALGKLAGLPTTQSPTVGLEGL